MKKFPPYPNPSPTPRMKRGTTTTIEPNFKDVMVDLETLGTRPGCGIVSIGAVEFDPTSGSLGREFYRVVNLKSCLAVGLRQDDSTLAWWNTQPVEVRKTLSDACADLAETFEVPPPNQPLEKVLLDFTGYLNECNLNSVRVWGNGSDFDNAILAVAYAAVGKDLPWRFWNNRCYRTLKSILKGPSAQRQGTHHNALDDAKTQALHAIRLLR